MLSAFQRLSAFALMLLAAAWLWAADLAAIPPLTAPVLDSAQMMQPEARAELNAHLMQYSREKGSQIIVLTVPAIAPETPFDYAARAMQQYEPGRKEVSDGVLLLLVRDERKTHLAVGRGLEGAIPDVYAKRILDDVLRPYLQKGQTDAGIYAAVSQIEKLIAGEALPAPAAQARSEGSGDGWIMLLIVPFFCGRLSESDFRAHARQPAHRRCGVWRGGGGVGLGRGGRCVGGAAGQRGELCAGQRRVYFRRREERC